MSDQLWQLDACALLDGYRRRTLSPVEVVRACARRIDEIGSLNAFAATDLEGAEQEARGAERRYAAGSALPLDGVPVAVKDMFDTKGLRTAYGSAIFREHLPEADAEAVRRVRAAGGLIVGKTSTHEFAWGITCENPHYGATRNPWDPARVSGGSSGGSAVAVAAGAVPLALGTDTGGSIRIPAAFCGVVGHKPSYGSISTAGVFPLAPSLDHVGALARTPEDAALIWRLLADGEPPAAAAGPVAAPRIGIQLDGGLAPAEAEIVEAVERAAGALKEMGAQLEQVELPDPPRVQAAFAGIQAAEALSVHRRAGLFSGRAREYGPDVEARLRAAEGIDIAEYLAAQGSRGGIREQLVGSLKRVDYLLTPVSAGPPKTIGAGEEAGNSFRRLVMGFTMPQNVAGLPALVLRGGADRLGLPAGIQLTAAPGRDADLLELGARLQQALGGTPGWPPPVR